MTAEQSASVAIGLLSGIGSATLQVANESPTLSSVAGMAVPLLSALIGGAVGYGMLKTTVETMRAELTGVRDDLSDVHGLLRDISTRVARIEGRLDVES